MKDEIRQFIVETFMYGEGELADDDALFDSGIIDSLGFIKLLSFIEEKFNVAMDMSEVGMESFNTINEIVETIKSKS